MATNLLPIQPALGFRASAVSNNTRRVKTSIANPTTVNGGGGGGSSWWSPLFGWSSEPDYIDSSNKEDQVKSGLRYESITDPEPKRVKSKFAPGCFTEEKAKQLRKMTSDTESFHDVMYHSAIASRLATDFSRRQ